MTLLPSLKKPLAAVILCSLIFGALSADTDFEPTEDGLYAVFTTSEGEFTAKLHYDLAPITVANFVGLAEGSVLRWDDEDKVPIGGPFYEGTIFHRVIDEFIIQGGDPDGDGFGGPGYPIPDEIAPSLSHDRAGILSMAKSGPNSAGSQFFITLNSGLDNNGNQNPYPTPLDGEHAIFGEIIEGLDNVEAIGDVPVNSADKPTADVVLLKVTIIREGEDAASFDPRDYDVPNVFYPETEFDLEGANKTATFARKDYANYYIRQSTDLEDWELDDESVTAGYGLPESHEIDITEDIEDEGASFLRIMEVTNTHTVDAEGIELSLELESNPNLTINFGEEFGGTYTFGESEGNLAGYTWYPLVDRDQVRVGLYEIQTQMQIYLTWTSETGGEVFARVIYPQEFNLTGTFTVSQTD